jgi:hypothetical protein
VIRRPPARLDAQPPEALVTFSGPYTPEALTELLQGRREWRATSRPLPRVTSLTRAACLALNVDKRLLSDEVASHLTHTNTESNTP